MDSGGDEEEKLRGTESSIPSHAYLLEGAGASLLDLPALTTAGSSATTSQEEALNHFHLMTEGPDLFRPSPTLDFALSTPASPTKEALNFATPGSPEQLQMFPSLQLFPPFQTFQPFPSLGIQPEPTQSLNISTGPIQPTSFSASRIPQTPSSSMSSTSFQLPKPPKPPSAPKQTHFQIDNTNNVPKRATVQSGLVIGRPRGRPPRGKSEPSPIEFVNVLFDMPAEEGETPVHREVVEDD
ncbi:hypothetical protein HDU97_004393 [Phlyctochytrium planicorne]|nr:hypothetical protein HDU97_004393 [Phlyctochytrium planicorne]